MLYTINKSATMFNNLASALRIAAKGDPILLYEDGVYAAMADTSTEALLREAMSAHPVYALQEDLDARGIDRCLEGVEVIDYDGFVALVEEHHIVPWL
jgi:tRNA 2-thiouridine synthesizing protein B